MKELQKVKLCELVNFQTGPFGTQFSASEYVEKGIPVINVKNIGIGKIIDDNLDFISETTRERLSQHILHEGDIVFGRKGSVDRHAYVFLDEDGWVQGSDCIRARGKVRVNMLFLSQYLEGKSVKKQIMDSAVGSTMPSLNTDILKDIFVLLPSIKEQNKISSVLQAISKKISVNEKINDNLEQQAKLIYDYWFTQFDFPDKNGKPYCSSGGKMVWNEQLKRNIPENWKVAQLKDIFNVSGKPISRDDCQTDAYYTPIDVIPKRTITFAGGLSAAEANSSLQVYEENNILLGAMRVYFHRVCISAQSGITRTTTLVLKPKVDEYLGYAYQVLNDDNAILYATQHSSGTQQPYIKWNDVLENYRFAMPSNPKLLYEYSKISEPLITKAKNCARETEQLRKLRDWLLPMLMNGQATIND